MLTNMDDVAPFADLQVDKMPAHWLMARLGKRVLRPGGIETTRWLIEHAEISEADDVIELAPGLGVTAKEILAQRPRSYTGLERDERAAQTVERAVAGNAATILRGDASMIPLHHGAASIVFGEAMLSMQPEAKKRAILAEARRVLRRGGRYAIHELALAPDDIAPDAAAAIERDLSTSIHVGVRIGTCEGWRRLLEDSGFAVEALTVAPMRLLELDRLIADEGLARTTRFVLNAMIVPGAARRLWDVRRVFQKHEKNLCAVALVARRKG